MAHRSNRAKDQLEYRIVEGLFVEIEVISLATKGTGRGTALIDAIEREACEAGCGAAIVGWNTNPRFWSKRGYQPLENDILYLSLAQEEGVRLVPEEPGIGGPVMRYLFHD